MSEPKRYEVNGCVDCPFVGETDDLRAERCNVTGDEIAGGSDGDLPKWCPLIQQDVLVVLR